MAQKRIHESYSYEDVVATLDGSEVMAEFDGDDAITIEYSVDAGSMLVGASGSSLFSVSADRSAMITLKVMHTSPTHRRLEQLHSAQQGRSRRGFPFSLRDTYSNEGGACDKAFIEGRPSKGYGTNATVREWKLRCGDWQPTVPKEF